MRGRARVLALVVLLGAAVTALELAGGALPPPPLRSADGFLAWSTAHDPVVVAFSVVRVLALGLAWYSLIVVVAGVVAGRLAATRVSAGIDRFTLPPLRRLLAATMSVGIGTASLTPAAAPAPAAATAPPSTATTVAMADSLTMRELPPAAETPVAVDGAARTWTVRPGECFWSIAEDVLASALTRTPTVAEIIPYWRRLIDANRSVLADRANPDLVFPGQVFTLPDTP